MDNQIKPTEPKLPSSKDSGNTRLALSTQPEAKKAIAIEIHNRFHAMKTYGKEPESLASITATMLADMADFPPDKILAAFRTHAQRSQEFPTTADLVGLIRRNGKPPLKESDIIAIRKKDGQDRTSEDWALLKEWDADQQQGWKEFSDPAKDAATLEENVRLRQKMVGLELEVKRLNELLHQERMAKGLEKPKPSMQEKIQKTINAMRAAGAPEDDIETFIKDCGIAA